MRAHGAGLAIRLSSAPRNRGDHIPRGVRREVRRAVVRPRNRGDHIPGRGRLRGRPPVVRPPKSGRPHPSANRSSAAPACRPPPEIGATTSARQGQHVELGLSSAPRNRGDHIRQRRRPRPLHPVVRPPKSGRPHPVGFGAPSGIICRPPPEIGATTSNARYMLRNFSLSSAPRNRGDHIRDGGADQHQRPVVRPPKSGRPHPSNMQRLVADDLFHLIV